jgi:cytochrome P450 family 144
MRVLQDPIEFFGPEAIQDPYPVYDRWRAEGSVHQIGNSGFYAVCSWDAINEAINRPEDFSSNLTATMLYTPEGAIVPFEMDQLGGPTQILATADDPAHAAHRKMLVPELAAKRIRVIEQFATETAQRLWTDGLRNGRIEWMGAMANRLPMMVVGRLIGVPGEDVEKLVRWGYAGTQLLEGLVSADELAAAGVAIVELGSYIADHFERAAADPQDNMLGELASACASGKD